MKKLGMSLALCAALSFTVAAAIPTPVEAAKAKSSKSSSKTKVKVSKSAGPASVGYFHSCVGTAGSGWTLLTPFVATGCGAVFAIPVIIESIFWRA